jgi:hypothetical protein
MVLKERSLRPRLWEGALGETIAKQSVVGRVEMSAGLGG